MPWYPYVGQLLDTLMNAKLALLANSIACSNASTSTFAVYSINEKKKKKASFYFFLVKNKYDCFTILIIYREFDLEHFLFSNFFRKNYKQRRYKQKTDFGDP